MVTLVQEFRRHLTCADPGCLQLLEAPKMLPCLHRFCTECLKKQLDRQLNNFNQLQPAGADRRPDQYRCPLDHCKALTGIDFHDDPLHTMAHLPRYRHSSSLKSSTIFSRSLSFLLASVRVQTPSWRGSS